jgi:hypothetical protein
MASFIYLLDDMNLYKVVYFLGLGKDPHQHHVMQCEECKHRYYAKQITRQQVKNIVDIHHINPAGLGRKSAGRAYDVRYLIGLCRECHDNYAVDRELHLEIVRKRLPEKYFWDDAEKEVQKLITYARTL